MPLYFLIKAINGLIQSPCWAINLVIMSNWFPRTGRGILLGLWGCNTSVGDIIGAQVFKFSSKDDNLHSPFFIIAAIVATMGILSFLLIVEAPEDVDIIFDDEGKPSEEHIILRKRRKKIGFWRSFTIPGIVEFAVCMFFGKMVLKAMFYWIITYLEEEMHYSKEAAIDIFSWFEIGSLVGNVLLGLTSDLLPVRSPLFLFATLFSAALVACLGFHKPIDEGGSRPWLTANLSVLGSMLIGKAILIAAI
jgi:sugar phosphate permease